MESISDKDTAKKKKRRKRKKSTAAVKSTTTRAEKIVKQHKAKEFDTAELEIIKKEVSENLGHTKSNPQHIFSIQNLFMTVLVTCLVVLTIVAGYLVGLFDSLQNEKDNVDFGVTNSIEMENSTVSIANYQFVIPLGYTHVSDPNSLLYITDVISGINIEVAEIITVSDLYSEKSITKYRNELADSGYVVYGSYVYDDEYGKYLVYSGVDGIGTECRVIYGMLNNKSAVKLLVTSEFESLTDDIYISVAELLGN